MSLQHFQNPNKAINQEILVRLHNRVWQRLDLFTKSCSDFTDGASLPGIWQASCANLVHHSLKIHTEHVKLPTVTKAVVSEFSLLRCNISLAICHDLSFFLLECIDGSMQPHTLLL
jgi:hypothetical protein